MKQEGDYKLAISSSCIAAFDQLLTTSPSATP